MDWQLHGGESAHEWRNRYRNWAKDTCACPDCLPPARSIACYEEGTIRVDGPISGYYTLDLPAGIYDVLYLGSLRLPLSERIELTEPGALVITASEPTTTEDGEVFYVRVGRPRRTRVIEH